MFLTKHGIEHDIGVAANAWTLHMHKVLNAEKMVEDLDREVRMHREPSPFDMPMDWDTPTPDSLQTKIANAKKTRVELDGLKSKISELKSEFWKAVDAAFDFDPNGE